MKNNWLRSFIFIVLAAIFAVTMLSGSSAPQDDTEATDDERMEDETGALEFRPVDCSLPSLDVYEYPFLGLSARLSEDMLEKMNAKEVFVFTMEDYTMDNEISYGVMRFSATTEADRNAEPVISVDIYEFEAGLEKIGAIGVYEKDIVSQIDELTDCDIHEKIGESADGAYEYYISVNSNGDQALAEQLKKTVITISEMHELDLSMGYSAFSTDRVEGIDNVGVFSTEDVFGNTCSQDIFYDYDLTLVNVFATWCAPCVDEIPVLEKIRQEYAEKGIKLGVAAVVYDAKSAREIDEGALERAKTLYADSSAQFPFLIPDDGNMNERLTGIANFPESFFVDCNGNIVSEPYIGVKTQEEWEQIIDMEFEKLHGEN